MSLATYHEHYLQTVQDDPTLTADDRALLYELTLQPMDHTTGTSTYTAETHCVDSTNSDNTA